jgi:hypothetical protein
MSAIDALRDLGFVNNNIHGCLIHEAIFEIEARMNIVEGWVRESVAPPTTTDQEWMDPPMGPISQQPIQRTTRANAHMEQNTCNIPTIPTDDELVDKYCTFIYTNLSLTLRDLVVVRNWLCQFIAEVRKGDKT